MMSDEEFEPVDSKYFRPGCFKIFKDSAESVKSMSERWNMNVGVYKQHHASINGLKTSIDDRTAKLKELGKVNILILKTKEALQSTNQSEPGYNELKDDEIEYESSLISVKDEIKFMNKNLEDCVN